MSEATISFANHDQIRMLFGPQDQYLRQVRDRVGIDVVLRDDELRLQGDDDKVRKGLDVFAELKAIIERTGQLGEAEVLRVLGSSDGPAGNGAAAGIDLFERARKVHPRSEGQVEYVRALERNDLVFCAGPAGSGKTYLAVAMGINAMRREQVRKIVLVRPAVEAGEKLGFLPGDIFAKVNPYLRPLLDALNDILDYETVKRYIEKDVIEIVPLAFMRGRTLNQTFMILDEGQNTTVTQMKMFLTRMGEGSKIVVTGDTTQIDLPPHMNSGLIDAMHRLRSVDSVAIVELTGRDIVRHRLVRDIVQAYDKDARGAKSRRS
jgi:phosphate starvation-inducible PhoH-like protein